MSSTLRSILSQKVLGLQGLCVCSHDHGGNLEHAGEHLDAWGLRCVLGIICLQAQPVCTVPASQPGVRDRQGTSSLDEVQGASLPPGPTSWHSLLSTAAAPEHGPENLSEVVQAW